jgi:hypothetical protein
MNKTKKNNKNIIRKNNKTIKYGSGISNLFNSKKIDTPTVLNSSSTISTNVFPEKKILTNANIATGVMAASLATKASIGILSASGVGIPIAGGLAVILLVANKISEKVIANEKLNYIINEVIRIINECNNINNLINLINNNIKFFINSVIYDYDTNADNDNIFTNITNNYFYNIILNDNDRDTIEKLRNRDDTVIKSQLPLLFNDNIDKSKTEFNDDKKFYLVKFLEKINNNVLIEKEQISLKTKIDKLLELLIKIAPNEAMVNISKLNEQINTEVKNREKTPLINFFNSLERFSKRTMSAEMVTNDIINLLTIINASFINWKFRFDFTIQYYERKFGVELWRIIWIFIEQTTEYKDYINPKIQSNSESIDVLNYTKTQKNIYNDKLKEIFVKKVSKTDITPVVTPVITPVVTPVFTPVNTSVVKQ